MFRNFSRNGEIIQCNLREYVFSLVAKKQSHVQQVAVTINRLNVVAVNTCWGLNSTNWFPVVDNHHQTNSRDLHTPIIRIPYDKGLMTSISECLDIGWFILSIVCWNPATYITLLLRFHTCQVVGRISEPSLVCYSWKEPLPPLWSKTYNLATWMS